MRSAFFLLSACSAVAQATDCQAADEATMLQGVMRQKRMKASDANSLDAQGLVKSLQHVANNLDTMSTDEVNQALQEAADALATLSPAIQDQVAILQAAILDAAAAVDGCHVELGAQQRAALWEAAEAQAALSVTCEAELATAVEDEAHICSVASVEDMQSECACNEARLRREDKEELCASIMTSYGFAYCEHNLQCNTYHDCHETETAVYNQLRDDMDDEMAPIELEYIAAQQSACIMDIIQSAMLSGGSIDFGAVAACSVVDTSTLLLVYPVLPAAPEACPAPTTGSPDCELSDTHLLSNPNSLASPPSRPWRLAFNIDTGDGHAVHYGNAEFWETDGLGGATSDLAAALTQDYKNPTVFSSGTVKEVLVVVHDEGEMLGWRRWRATQSHSSLRDYFTASNTCDGGTPSLANTVHLADETIDAETGQLDPHEPLVVNTAGMSAGTTTDLWVNAGGGNDFNRLSTAQSPPENGGYGLGTVYDLQTNGWSLCGTATMRPQADAQFHTDQHHWGSGGGIGGLIGTDHICNTDGAASCPEGRCSGCPWTVASGINYDYAVFVSYHD